MRRGVGVGALKHAQQRKSDLALHGREISARDVEAMREQVAVFRERLEEFARSHKRDINRDPVLRKRFHEMCTRIGVDPLASQKGFWAQTLGVGDFYYELAVQIIDVCVRTRHRNGGFLEIGALCNHLNSIRPKTAQTVSTDDIERSLGKIKILGSGFQVTTIQDSLKIVQSVPLELNHDHAVVLQTASAEPSRALTVERLCSVLKWDRTRSLQALEFLEHAAMAWIDDGDLQGAGRRWYFPTLHPELLVPA